MLLPLSTAQEIVLNHVVAFGTENVPLEAAHGRVLAMPIVADRDYPPFNRSAMDGIAIMHTDFEKGMRCFNIAETIFAGEQPKQQIQSGYCYKIMTGAAVPLPADCVIRIEDCTVNNNSIQINSTTAQPWQHIARKGQDVLERTTVMQSGTLCTPYTITTLAALGYHTLTVHQLPKVALFTTGNEVQPVHQSVNEVQIRNSNQHLLQSLLKQHCIQPEIQEHIPDDPNLLQAAFLNAQTNECNLIICCGGVSAGDADFVPDAMLRTGIKPLFHKVAIKPGKPIWCGLLPNKGLVFALPGNPISCLTTFLLFVAPYLKACWQMPSVTQPTLCLPLGFDRQKKTKLDEFFPVCLHGAPTIAHALPFNGSGDIQTMVHANGLAHHPAHKDFLQRGDIVNILTI